MIKMHAAPSRCVSSETIISQLCSTLCNLEHFIASRPSILKSPNIKWTVLWLIISRKSVSDEFGDLNSKIIVTGWSTNDCLINVTREKYLSFELKEI